MTTRLDLSDPNVLAGVRQFQLKAAQGNFRAFLKLCVTKDADGYPVPVPIALFPGEPDPLQERIDSGELQPRPAPWPHITEMAIDLGSGVSVKYLKARQMMFTWVLAAFCVYKASIRGDVFYLSQGEKYAQAVIERCKYIWDNLPVEVRGPRKKGGKWNDEEMQLKDGLIGSFPSTENAVRSLSGKLVIADEAAFHQYAAENHAAWGPALSGSEAQFVILTTSNGPQGWAYDQIEATRRGEDGAIFRFYPWHARPDHDQAWYENEKRKYPNNLARFIRENPSTIEEAWSAAEGLVYPSFNSTIHVGVPPIPFEQCQWRGGGADWGGSPGNPNAAVVLGVTKEGHVYQYDEYVADGEISIEEMGAFFSRWRHRAPFTFLECDWQNDTGIRILRRNFQLPARRAIKKREGIDITDFLLRNNRLTIDPGCVRSIQEFGSYRWAQRIDSNTKERYATSTPVDHHADCFVAGTLVTTARGGVPIEQIRKTDTILTRDGYRGLLASGISSLGEPTYRVRLSDGRTLTGTAEHPVWVEGRGFTHLDALRYGDIVAACNRSTATTTAKQAIRSTGTRRAGATVPRFIGTFGSSTTDRSLMASRSTTSTTTLTTTTLQTSSRSRGQSTLPTMVLFDTTSPLATPWSEPESGTSRMQGVSGIVNTDAPPTRHGLWCATCASSAGKNSSRARGGTSVSATPTAGLAPYVLAVEPTEKREVVYNLTVAGTPEFYANGILVHNCMDARRYYLQRLSSVIGLTGGGKAVTTVSGRPARKTAV